MNDSEATPAAAEPQEMTFEVLLRSVEAGVGSVSSVSAGARLGRLAFPGRKALDTPNFFTATSRGAIPHLTPDNVARHDGLVGGAYFALEDFIERLQKAPGRVAPLLQTAGLTGSPKPLHTFTALPDAVPTVLGPRRVPAAAKQLGNGRDFVSVFTSTGVQLLSLREYADAIAALKPDVAVPLADLNFASAARPSSKRGVRMADRTEEWMLKLRRMLDREELRASRTAVFAPALPVAHEIQWEYLRQLDDDDMADLVDGLAVYDVDIVPDLAEYANLAPLPRLSLDPPDTPHDILRQISLGVDVVLLPLITAASEAGVAFTFTFPPPPTTPSAAAAPPPEAAAAETTPTPNGTSAHPLLPLGTDLTHPSHATSLLPLSPSCTCQTCTTHHAAYIHHLLDAREMLAWTLLQIHNHHVTASLFAGVRASLALPGGAAALAADAARFAAAYEPDLPVGGGERPRQRGYHAKSRDPGAPPPPRLNKPAWGKLGAGGEDAVAM